MAKNKITLNVLADIVKKIGGPGIDSPDNRGLVVFTGSDIRLDERIEELKGLKTKGLDFSLAFSFVGERILDKNGIINSLKPIEVYGEEDIFRLEEVVDKYSYIIGMNPTINTISKVALGMIDSFVSNLIWAFLYKGKTVYLDFTSVRNYLGAPSNNKGVNDIIENNINKLKGMGAIQLDSGDYGGKLLRNNGGLPIVEGKRMNDGLNKVITERDIMNYDSNKSLVLPRGTIITPLAKDRVKELGMTVEIER